VGPNGKPAPCFPAERCTFLVSGKRIDMDTTGAGLPRGTPQRPHAGR
jgi:hypothetical protein